VANAGADHRGIEEILFCSISYKREFGKPPIPGCAVILDRSRLLHEDKMAPAAAVVVSVR
jgi:hypothetical protein